MRRHPVHAALGTLFVLAGCEEPQQSVWEGDLLTVTSSEGVELCGGTLGFLDRFVGHTYQYWTGSSPPNDFALELDLREGGPLALGGLATSSEGSAWASSNLGLTHELTHLVVGWEDGVSAPSLTEGIADGAGPLDAFFAWGPALLDPTEYAFLPRDEFYYPDGGDVPASRYCGPSAQLVAFLIDRYGVPTVREAYRSARGDQSAEEIEAAYLSVFGDDLFDAFDAYVDAPHCGLQMWECSDAVVPARELPVYVEQDVDCSDDTTAVGATLRGRDQWYPVHEFVIDLPEETPVLIDTTDNVIVWRVVCLDACEDVPWSPIQGFTDRIDEGVPWGPGRIYVTVFPADPSQPFSARIVPQ